MRIVLSSAVVTSYGTYEYIPIDIDGAREWLARGPYISYVGYPNMAAWLESRLGQRIPISRESCEMRPGDEALVARLRHRLVDPAQKRNGGIEVTDELVELGILRRLA